MTELGDKKKLGIIILFVIAGILFFAILDNATTAQPERTKYAAPSLSIEYSEDRTGILTLEQVRSSVFKESFLSNDGSFLTLGNNRSTWWIRIKVKSSAVMDNNLYLYINNPLVQNVILHIPHSINGTESYETKKSGWQYRDGTDDENFLYPLFKLSGDLDTDNFLYIRLQSAYVQNYNIRIITEDEFHTLQQRSLLFITLLLGILLSMAIFNFTFYLFIKDRTSLYYVIYIVSMILFQTAQLGVPKIFPGGFSRFLIMNTCAIGCLVIIASTGFVRSFLDIPKNAPKHDFAFKLLVAAAVLGIILMFTGLRLEANVVSNLLAYVCGILTLSAAIIAMKKRVRQAQYFLPAWAMLILGSGVFFFRSWGVLPNSFLARYFILIAAAIEALLIAFALVDRSRSLQEEKQNALLQLAKAKEAKRSAEIAFLQAQIKPHFLYNSLSVIAALSIKDPPRTKELLYNLSDYLRGSFHFEDRNGMTMLAEELTTVRAYLAIEKERFRDKLAVEYDIDENIKISIPLLTIQPLVENALRHGIFKKPEGGSVQISVKKAGNFVVIRVQDNGAGIPETKLAEILQDKDNSSEVGLRNIHKRLLLHYGQGLEIESREGFGTIAIVKIPATSGGRDIDQNNNC